jgi:asparagine synthase (glutamine-hydrolysing)
MAHSYRVGLPFLDHRIVEFAARLPEDLKIRAGRPKFVLGELLRGRNLQRLQQPRQTEFEALVHEWFRGALRPLLLDTLNEHTVRESGILEWPAVEGVIHAHLVQRANLGYHLWGLVVLFLWMRRWGITAPSRSEATPASSSI